MPKSMLPREGLTLEAAFAPVRLTVLQPLLTGAVILAASQSHILETRWPSLAKVSFGVKPIEVLRTLRSTRTLAFLGVFFVFGTLRKLNRLMSRLVLNNFNTDTTWNWPKEVVVVTGGSGGIGGMMVQRFADKNATVISLDIAPPQTPVSLPNVHYFEVDITSSSKIKEVADKIREAHGEPTVLINNAGIGPNKTIFDETEAEIRRVFDVNTISHFLLVKEFVPAMAKNNHGHVVTVASMASFMVHAQNVDYTCTKASALAFHEGLGQELKSRYNADKVRTTIVHPTWIRTPLTAHLLAKPGGFNDFVLEPETVADAVVKQVLSGYGGQLILPSRLIPVSGLRGLPSWIQEGMRNDVNQVLNLEH